MSLILAIGDGAGNLLVIYRIPVKVLFRGELFSQDVGSLSQRVVLVRHRFSLAERFVPQNEYSKITLSQRVRCSRRTSWSVPDRDGELSKDY